MDRMPVTRAGYDALVARLRHLKGAERQDVAREIEIARGHGDLRENADYDAAKERQGMLEATIRDLTDKLARAEIIDTAGLDGDRVVFGATVTLYDPADESETTLTLVGEVETDVDAGRISVASPLAKALLGRTVDDEVVFKAPGGVRRYEIINVEFR